MPGYINGALLKEQLKRFWAVPALSVLGYMLMMYLPLFSATSTFRTLREVFQFGVAFGYIPLIAVTPLVAAFCVYGGFFKTAAVAQMYSYPMSKSKLFITNALVGAILSVLPVFVFCVFAFSLNNVSIIAIADFLFIATITSVFNFAIVSLAFSVAGHGFIAVLLAAVLPFVPTALMFGGSAVIRMYIFGYYQPQNGFIGAFFLYHTPTFWITFLIDFPRDRLLSMYFPGMIYCALTVAMFIGAYFVFRARKPERTGDSIMFTSVKNVLVFGVALVAGIIFGVIWWLFSNGNLVIVHIGLLVGFAIGYVIAQMIAEKTFLVFEKIRFFPHFAGTAAALYVLMIVITQFGLVFFVNRIPPENQIYGVFASHSLPPTITGAEWRRISNSCPQAIAAVREAHGVIIGERSYLHRIPNVDPTNRYAFERRGRIYTRENLFITYVLHNGHIVTRQYSLPGTFIARTGMSEFLNSSPVVLAQFPAFTNPDLVTGVRLRFTVRTEESTNNERYEATVLNRAQIQEVMRIIEQSAVENAIEARENPLTRSFSSWSGDGGVGSVSVASISFTHREPRVWRLGSAPNIRGEGMVHLFKLMEEWGLLESSNPMPSR